MSLFDYLEAKFLILRIELQKDFQPVKDAELKAVFAVLEGYRTLLKWLKMPLLLGDYLLVKVGLRQAPIKPQLTVVTQPPASPTPPEPPPVA
jgi:hypothetical protein